LLCRDFIRTENIEKSVKKSSIGETHRVEFVGSKDEAELVFTDNILSSDTEYEKIGWSPLVIAFDIDKKKVKSYEKEGYITEDNNDTYTIKFDKIIDETLEGNWKEKIYYPNLDTVEGKLFYDFLLININGGAYPKDEEKKQECISKANKFLECDSLIQADTKKRLEAKRKVEGEIYVIFENDISQLAFADEYSEYGVAYPGDTVIKEWYWKCKSENAEKTRENFTYKGVLDVNSDLGKMLTNKYIRSNENQKFDKLVSNTRVGQGFSYVEVPLKE